MHMKLATGANYLVLITYKPMIKKNSPNSKRQTIAKPYFALYFIYFITSRLFRPERSSCRNPAMGLERH